VKRQHENQHAGEEEICRRNSESNTFGGYISAKKMYERRKYEKKEAASRGVIINKYENDRYA
jgi:hypothetical protein